MITFIDGPAAPLSITLPSAPPFIRVAGQNGQLDIIGPHIDYTGDHVVRVYQREGEPIVLLLCKGGALSVSGCACGGRLPIASYRFSRRQPPVGSVNTAERWRRWCRSHNGGAAC